MVGARNKEDEKISRELWSGQTSQTQSEKKMCDCFWGAPLRLMACRLFTTDNIDTTPNGLGAISTLMINFRVNRRSFRRLKNIQNVQHITRKKKQREKRRLRLPQHVSLVSSAQKQQRLVSLMNDVTPTASFSSRGFLSFWYFYNCCQTRARGDILFLVAVSSSRRVIHNFFWLFRFLADSLCEWLFSEMISMI